MSKEQAYQRFIGYTVGWLPTDSILKRYAIKLIDSPDPVGVFREMISELNAGSSDAKKEGQGE